MKRHKCFICNQKRYEEEMIRVTHVGKNGVAYFGWVCKSGSYRTDSKNYNAWGKKIDCEAEYRRRKENKDI